jgi:glycosyltransferase involved in cell wall biosynthesis
VSRVAVIVPTYDDGALVAEAVASVREDEPVELVVVDDGSTDPSSLAVLADLERRGVRVLHQANAGPSLARAAGLAVTTAPYVFPLDADDLLEPGALGALADLLDTTPSAGFAWGDYQEFGDKHERYRAPRRFLPWTTTYVNLYSPSCLFRREALDAAGGWPPILYEDWAVILGLVELGVTGVHLDAVTFHRRLAGASGLTKARRDHAVLYADLRRRYPGAFAARRALARAERPAAWKRVVYPLVYGRRLLVPAGLEDSLRKTRLWTLLRPLRR